MPNEGTGPLIYSRDVLIAVLVYHRPGDAPPPYTFRCGCGWGQRPEHLGRSWADHVADVYETSVMTHAE